MTAEWRKALFIVWITVSAALGCAAVAPFLVPENTITRMVPTCEAKLHGRRCMLCGATTGFLAIGSGDWRGAQHANAASLPLFAGFSADAFGAAAILFRRILKCR